MNQATKTESKGFYAAYVRFYAEDAKAKAYLMGPDNCVGDVLHFETRSDEDGILTQVLNRFDKEIGKLEAKDSQNIRILEEKNWAISGLLDFIAASTEKETTYIAQIIVFACPKEKAEVLDVFVKTCGKALFDGKRLDPLLTPTEQKKMFTEDGAYLPERKRKLAKDKELEYLKTEASFKEKMIEQGRQKNPGCYAVSIIGLILIGAGLVWLVSFFLGLF